MKYAKKSLQTWYNTPAYTGEEAEKLYIRFCGMFHRKDWRNLIAITFDWKYYRIIDNDSVLDHPIVQSCKDFYVFGGPQEVRLASIADLKSLPDEAKRRKLYFVPRDWSWCLCRRRDGSYRIYDPSGKFGEYGIPGEGGFE